jgi:hypothetical protein
MKMLHRLAIFACLVALFSPAVYAQEKYTLRLNFAEGQRFQQRMQMSQVIDQEMNGVKMTMTQEMTMDYDYAVTKVGTGGVATIACTYTRVASKASAPGGEMSFDSAAAEQPIAPQFRPLAAMVGKIFTMQIGSSGAVYSLEGMSEILDVIVGEMNVTESEREQVLVNMKRQFGEEAMIDLVEQSMAIYPANPVAVGEDWSKTIEITQMVPLKLDNTWVLKEVSGDTATLEVASLVSSIEGKTTTNMAGAEFNVHLEGAQSGTTTIDRETGWVIASSVHQNLDGAMVLPATEGQQAGLSVPIGIRSTVTLGPVD